MLELIRRLPSSPGLLALLLLSISAVRGLTPAQRYHQTSDGSLAVLYVFDDEALLQRHLPAPDEERSSRIDLVKAHPGEEPEKANALGDVVKRDLVGGPGQSGAGDQDRARKDPLGEGHGFV